MREIFQKTLVKTSEKSIFSQFPLISSEILSNISYYFTMIEYVLYIFWKQNFFLRIFIHCSNFSNHYIFINISNNLIHLVSLGSHGQVKYQNGTCLDKEELKLKKFKMKFFNFYVKWINLIIKMSFISDHENVVIF